MEKKAPFANDPTAFKEEEFRFNEEHPYFIFRKYHSTDRRIRSHYHQAIEILAGRGVRQAVFVEGRLIDMEKHDVVIIPADRVHSIHEKKGPGYVLVFQLSLAALGTYVNIPKIFENAGFSLEQLPLVSDAYHPVAKILHTLEKAGNESIFKKISLLISIFEILIRAAPHIKKPAKDSGRIREIIKWTGENFRRKVTLDEVAGQFDLSKFYFCKYFKDATGQTYAVYLNQVRLDHAKQLLAQRRSVSDACYESGFENLSYFIQFFRKATGETPGRFKKAEIRKKSFLQVTAKII